MNEHSKEKILSCVQKCNKKINSIRKVLAYVSIVLISLELIPGYISIHIERPE